MTQVVAMNGAVIPSPSDPHPEVIAELERLLQMARDSEIACVLAAYQYTDGSASTCCIGYARGYSLMGAAARLLHKEQERMDRG